MTGGTGGAGGRGGAGGGVRYGCRQRRQRHRRHGTGQRRGRPGWRRWRHGRRGGHGGAGGADGRGGAPADGGAVDGGNDARSDAAGGRRMRVWGRGRVELRRDRGLLLCCAWLGGAGAASRPRSARVPTAVSCCARDGTRLADALDALRDVGSRIARLDRAAVLSTDDQRSAIRGPLPCSWTWCAGSARRRGPDEKAWLPFRVRLRRDVAEGVRRSNDGSSSPSRPAEDDDSWKSGHSRSSDQRLPFLDVPQERLRLLGIERMNDAVVISEGLSSRRRAR